MKRQTSNVKSAYRKGGVKRKRNPAPADTSARDVKINAELDPVFDKLPDSVKRVQVWAQSQPAFVSAVQAEMDWSPEDVADLYKHKGEPAYPAA